ncbi:MAG: hypothetical protein IT324_16750 [Anaerolineae bacterium]|nr:hypothetical protein [Anaerolineae bacterium]
MEPSSETLDRFMIAALLQSDTVINAIQRELHTLYPGQVVASSIIRCMLRSGVVSPDILNDERSTLAQAKLAGLTAHNSKHLTNGSTIPVVPCEETVQEVLMYDKTYATRGG